MFTRQDPDGRSGRRSVLMVARRALLAAASLSVVGTGLVLVPGAAEAAQHRPFQADCGVVTCTVRLDRAQTRNARDVGGLIGITAAICGSFSGFALAPVCGAAIAPVAGVVALAANRYYEQGDCLQIKFVKPSGSVNAAWPGKVERGTRNCS